jgi:hypothetical protein
MVPCPVVVGLTLCDYVIVEERTKKVSLVGSFTGIAVERFPAVVPAFSLFAVVTDGIGTGTVEVIANRLDTAEEVASYRGPLRFPDQLTEVSFHLRLRQFTVPSAGLYQFTLLIDGEWVAQRRFRVYAKEDQT